MNAAKVVGKKKEDLRVVVNGAGAAGTAAARLISRWGVGDIVVCDRHGILARGEKQPSAHMEALAVMTNCEGRTGTLADALKDADVFVGLSTGGLLHPAHIRSMAKSAIVFACANPEPEIMPAAAIEAGAAIAGSGRFDAANQCNNVLAFPGIMRGAVDIAAERVTETMCLAASRVIAAHVRESDLAPGNVLPTPLDPDLCPAVAEAVAAQGAAEGKATKPYRAGEIAARVRAHNRRTAKQQMFLQDQINGFAETTAA
jgi:malate dehydrogenase (oxaloacetate-decarboxylating)